MVKGNELIIRNIRTVSFNSGKSGFVYNPYPIIQAMQSIETENVTTLLAIKRLFIGNFIPYLLYILMNFSNGVSSQAIKLYFLKYLL